MSDVATTLYRIYGERSRLLYVGITDDYDQRMRDHSEKSWWVEVRRIDTEEHETRAEAAGAELAAIRAESPIYNRMGNSAKPARRIVPPANATGKRQWLTQGEAADYLGVTDRTLRRWVSEGKLPAYRVGVRLMRVDMRDVEALLRPIPSATNGWTS